jgi:hypothetical protein
MVSPGEPESVSVSTAWHLEGVVEPNGLGSGGEYVAELRRR